MSNKEVFVIRRKRLLPWLLALQLLPLSLAMLTFYLAPQFEEVFKHNLGDDTLLPLITRVLLRSYWLSLLIPLGMALFSVWACLKATSPRPAFFIGIATIVASLAYPPLLFTALFLPLLKVLTSVST